MERKEQEGEKPFERMKELTKRILTVPKSAIEKKSHAKIRRKKRLA